MGVVLCMYETSTRLAGEVVADLRGFFEQGRGRNLPWSSARIFESVIRRNVKLAECPSYGKTIFDYEPRSNGAADYKLLADEFLAQFGQSQAPPAQTFEAPAETRQTPAETSQAPVETTQEPAAEVPIQPPATTA